MRFLFALFILPLTFKGIFGQTGYEKKLVVTDFVKGLPDDLEKNVVILDKAEFIKEIFFIYGDIDKINRQWKKCLNALKDYPFQYIVLDTNNKDPAANDAKYQFKFFPEFTKKQGVNGAVLDKILTVKDKTTGKHYGLREQKEYGNSKANFSYLVEPQKVFLLFGRLNGLSLQACLAFAMFVALRGLRRKSEVYSLRKH
ncbi:MAG: hypothetical protein SGJ15_11950 [Bacteroidota bacterium]|nr:hypothetical protein [Bacteroidota bacterium]